MDLELFPFFSLQRKNQRPHEALCTQGHRDCEWYSLLMAGPKQQLWFCISFSFMFFTPNKFLPSKKTKEFKFFTVLQISEVCRQRYKEVERWEGCSMSMWYMPHIPTATRLQAPSTVMQQRQLFLQTFRVTNRFPKLPWVQPSCRTGLCSLQHFLPECNRILERYCIFKGN